jgi:hypothetical protein
MRHLLRIEAGRRKRQMTAQDAIHALWTASIATPVDLKTMVRVTSPSRSTYRSRVSQGDDQWIQSRSPKTSTSRAGVFLALQL